ncbi:protein of unknown function DUF1428 [Pseudoalteromonas luteoviolacea B = ATCC 29581]|nr:protein of unknown function DUF1428 [Pseudoalteromonas luteoviolacea B = ATCC 29581]
MPYVDGYLLAVKTNKKQEYIKLAIDVAAIFKEYGALSVVENWGEDIPDGVLTSFPLAVKLESDETVVFSWAVWPSKAARDKGMKAAMNDDRMQQWDPSTMPMDGKRMIFGGFETIVNI